MTISERLLQAYKIAKNAPTYKSAIELPEGYIHVIFEAKRLPQKTKKELVAACKKIEMLVKANARELKERGIKITMKDILRDEAKIRAQLVKEKYGI